MKLLIITLSFGIALGCSNPARPLAQDNKAAPANNGPEKLQTAVAHGPDMKQPGTGAPAGQSKWSQSGEPVDTSQHDAAIMAAEKALREKPNDAEAKRALGAAFFKRATVLTEARQYASALGDYRRAVKHDPSNTEAKEWIDRIVSIYSSINRDSPKEGEEPPPLPYSKGS